MPPKRMQAVCRALTGMAERARDLGALAAGADLQPERGSIDDPAGRDRERKRDIGNGLCPKNIGPMTGKCDSGPRSIGGSPGMDVGFAPMVSRAAKLEKPKPKITMPMPLMN